MIPSTEDDLATLAAVVAGCPGRPRNDNTNGAPQFSYPSPDRIKQVVRAIASGDDPLGDAFCRLRPSRIRRNQGAVYTPAPIVESMITWAATEGTPQRVVDPGAGSGRFLFAAGRIFPRAELVAVESDPLAALVLRANATALGMAERLTLHVCDYRTIHLTAIDGSTLFIGNPPYVRHHDISPSEKDWLSTTAATFGLRASRLAGLHIHFVLKTCCLARPGDYGAFITSAEWLDVNYGDVVRKAFVNILGGVSLHVMAPTATPFPGSEVTGAISCFRVGDKADHIRLRSVRKPSALRALQGGRIVPKSRLYAARRWSPLLRPVKRAPRGYVELGELCRVHRGQVTGCNAVWIAGGYPGTLPDTVLIPSITRARELFNAVPALMSTIMLRQVIDLPVDLGDLDDVAQTEVHRFLRWAKSMGADDSYIAKNRRSWWAVQLRDPAPLLCTYMARRPPAFVRNPCGARHLNIAHGIYPREPLSANTLDALANWLQKNVSTSSGRTYAGGLTKFEPREIERILIPPPEQLHDISTTMDHGGIGERRRRSQGRVSGSASS